MDSREVNGGLDRINKAVGCLALGFPSQYDGNNTTTTKTIFVAETKQAYESLRRQGAKPISTASATQAWVAEVEENMTQFEFH